METLKCKVSCSFGEIIDKMTILNIKISKAKDKSVLDNLNNELTCIYNEIPLSKENDILFEKLRQVNLALWVLEDNIRLKSKNREYDKEYIEYAEKIHITNDERYRIKRTINEKYNSILIEEKIYTKDNETNKIHEKALNMSKFFYSKGKLDDALIIMEQLINEYKMPGSEINQFTTDIYFTYYNIVSCLGKPFEYTDVLNKIYTNIDSYNFSKEFYEYFKKMFCQIHLKNMNIEMIEKEINTYNCITGPGISKNNMSFLKNENETLLVYDGGGLGDDIMFGRFLPIVCNKYINNKIIFLVDDRLSWIFKTAFEKYNNLTVLNYSKRNEIISFHHHCSIIKLLYYLNLHKKSPCIEFNPYLDNLIKPQKKIDEFIDTINNTNKIYLLNWHGNYKNGHEIFNRGIALTNLEKILAIDNINFLIPTLEINQEEREILKKYSNVYILKESFKNFDKDKAFSDTMTLLENKNVNGLISTDTSLVHLSATMNKETHVLLTIGCDWRWNWYDDNDNSIWYPKINMYKQILYNDWGTPLKSLHTVLKTTTINL